MYVVSLLINVKNWAIQLEINFSTTRLLDLPPPPFRPPTFAPPPKKNHSDQTRFKLHDQPS